VLLLALALLRWKKKQNTLQLMKGSGGESGSGGGGLLTAGAGASGGGGGGGSQGMSERPRSIPFAIPAALASLSGSKRRSQPTGPEQGEKGFQKVAGRKLPSVLTSGGDGYTDPRNTVNTVRSEESTSSYRDSHAFFGGASKPRFAVGSPMRPESGIPVFQPGPSRTPVTEQGPFPRSDQSDRADSPTLEPPRRDPLGRSHPSQDGSNRSYGSASRFTEAI
jgi:hypothetical protein